MLIEDDEIAAVGVNLSPPSGVTVIDGRGMIVMPGFVDTHDHLWQSLIRGCAADDDLNGWLSRCTFPLSTTRPARPTPTPAYDSAPQASSIRA